MVVVFPEKFKGELDIFDAFVLLLHYVFISFRE